LPGFNPFKLFTVISILRIRSYSFDESQKEHLKVEMLICSDNGHKKKPLRSEGAV
jgi:hypothetical protein